MSIAGDHGHAPGGTAAEGVLAAAMWSYAVNVLYPAQWLKRSGIVPRSPPLGDLPREIPAPGLGPKFSRLHQRPVLLDAATDHDHLVVEFDKMAEVYDAFVRPFSSPIFDEALDEIRAFLHPDSRVLDAGCGAGRELQRIAGLVPHGEVVGVDLAAGMVNAAWLDARAHGFANCAFFQADVGALPDALTGEFDVVYNSLAHHHYPEPAKAASAVLRALRPGGVYCVIDPGPEWFNAVSRRFARWSDPGWIGFHSPEEFRTLLLSAGFTRASWREVLPGFGVAVGQKPLRVPRLARD
ncbi:MAG: class I SAM-dependent methyltransferase [Gemmatimonadota bacterium]|nr:class I SAM-dependent methyltransferase [Gemmatimonadota bacterium]